MNKQTATKKAGKTARYTRANPEKGTQSTR